MTHDLIPIALIAITIAILAGVYMYAPERYRAQIMIAVGIIGAILAGGIALLSRKKKPVEKPDPMPQHVPAPWIEQVDAKTETIKEEINEIKAETKRKKASGGLTDGRPDDHVFDMLDNLDE
jgi:hypothetical protein